VHVVVSSRVILGSASAFSSSVFSQRKKSFVAEGIHGRDGRRGLGSPLDFEI